MRLVKQLGTVAGVAVVGDAAMRAVTGSWLLSLVLGVATAVLALLAYSWVVRRTEHRDPVEVGLAGAGSAVGRGLGIGVLMFVAVIECITLSGGGGKVGPGVGAPPPRPPRGPAPPRPGPGGGGP